MAKLRKMLGKLDDPSVVALMALIETQSKTTLVRWSADYVEAHFLPLYQKACPEDTRLSDAVAGVKAWLAGTMPLKEVKPLLKEARLCASKTECGPTEQAAARAVATACAVLQTPTNALGFTFYGAAAAAYHKVGLTETPEVYDALAEEELSRMLDALRAMSVPDEPDPVQIKWSC